MTDRANVPAANRLFAQATDRAAASHLKYTTTVTLSEKNYVCTN
jgi:hypothetical protein